MKTNSITREPDRMRRSAPAQLRAAEVLVLAVRNDLAELGRVFETVEGLLRRHAVAEPVGYATQLALEEVLSNVIRHGFRDGAKHEIELQLCVGAGSVEIQVVDDGRAFDPVTAPDADLDVPLERRRVGGLGIRLLREFVREMRYERRGDRNTLRLVV